jgi:hypothetical protein
MVWVVPLLSMELIPHRLTSWNTSWHSEFDELADLSAFTNSSVLYLQEAINY